MCDGIAPDEAEMERNYAAFLRDQAIDTALREASVHAAKNICGLCGDSGRISDDLECPCVQPSTNERN